MVNRKTSVLFIALVISLLSGCKKKASVSQPPQRRHQETAGGKSGGQLALAEEARTVILKFQQALQESAWEKALSYCSKSVKAKAKEYESVEAFFKAVVPIETIVQTRRFRFYPVKGSTDKFYYVFDWSFHTSDPDMEHRIGWQPFIYKTDVGWTIDFRTTPLKEWIEQYKQDALWSRQRAKEREAERKAFEPKLKAVKAKTRLTLVSKEFVLGRPMLFRLELVNQGEEEFLYDHQQVAVNASMTITDENGKRVSYIAGPVQTLGWYKPIKPGESVVLFDDLDIAKQYDIKKPGRYKVQFNGNGLQIGITTGEEQFDPDNFIGIAEKFPSNTVEINVRPFDM